MIGYPGETLEEIERTIRLSLELPLDWASYTITAPHPGTDIYYEGLKSGRFPHDYWEKYTLGQESEPIGYFTSEQYDKKKLERFLKSAYRRFYFRPGQVVKLATNPRLWREFPQILRTLFEIKPFGMTRESF